MILKYTDYEDRQYSIYLNGKTMEEAIYEFRTYAAAWMTIKTVKLMRGTIAMAWKR